MGYVRLPTILRPLLNIFEGLVVFQNYENSLYGVYSKVKETHYLTHARYPGHSVSPVHSGLQCGGWPRCPGRQLHLSVPLLLLHWEKGPQGLGVQGSRHTARWLVTSHEESPPQEITEQGSQHLLLKKAYMIFSGFVRCPADMLIPFAGMKGRTFVWI